MSAHLPVIERLIDAFKKMPAVGRKSAERLAYYMLALPRSEATEFSELIGSLRNTVRICKECFALAEEDVCFVCRDANRDQSLLCVVERARDVIQIEKTGAFDGRYHVLQGKLAPVESVGPEQLRIRELIERVRKNDIKEVVLAMNPTTEGEATIHYLSEQLQPLGIRVSLPARGLPMGAEIEFTDASILGEAIRKRSLADG